MSQASDNPKPAETAFERRVREASEALDAMPDPDPDTPRQVIIALRHKIRARARGSSMKAVHQCFVALGYDIELSTFRDYIYNGGRSRAALAASEVLTEKKRKIGRSKAEGVHTASTAIPAIPATATESTAAGKPVRASKVR